MANPPPAANIPIAVTATVPTFWRNRTDRPISAYIVGNRPGIRAANGSGTDNQPSAATG